MILQFEEHSGLMFLIRQGVGVLPYGIIVHLG